MLALPGREDEGATCAETGREPPRDASRLCPGLPGVACAASERSCSANAAMASSCSSSERSRSRAATRAAMRCERVAWA